MALCSTLGASNFCKMHTVDLITDQFGGLYDSKYSRTKDRVRVDFENWSLVGGMYNLYLLYVV